MVKIRKQLRRIKKGIKTSRFTLNIKIIPLNALYKLTQKLKSKILRLDNKNQDLITSQVRYLLIIKTQIDKKYTDKNYVP